MTVVWDNNPTTVVVTDTGGLVTVPVAQTLVTTGALPGPLAVYLGTLTADVAVSNSGAGTLLFPILSLEPGTYQIDCSVTFGSGSGSSAGTRIYSLAAFAGNPSLSAPTIASGSTSQVSTTPAGASASISYGFTIASTTDIYIMGVSSSLGMYARYTNTAGYGNASHYRINRIS